MTTATKKSDSEKKEASAEKSISGKRKVAVKTTTGLDAAPTPSYPYAVIRTGGHQYVVSPGTQLNIEKLAGEIGETIEFNDILCARMSADAETMVGTPVVKGVVVKAKLVTQDRAKKIRIFKKKRRTGYTKRQGHRQDFTRIEVQSIAAA